MKIPTVRRVRRSYESEAKQEIWAFGVARTGLCVQVASSTVDKVSRSPAEAIAWAMYQPDRGLERHKLATADHPISPILIVGWVLSLIGILWVARMRFLRGKAKDIAMNQAESPEGLRGCAHVLHGILILALGKEKEPNAVRVTVYGIEGDFLEQSIEYVGCAGGKVGRRFPISVGIIGKAARTREMQTGERRASTEDDYMKELVEDWGFTFEMARKIVKGRQSFIAVPIMDEAGTPVGVVYADSTEKEAFNGLEQYVAASTKGMTAYISERFK